MRTQFHHTLRPETSGEDRKKVELCQSWFQGVCGSADPVKEADFLKALRTLLADAEAAVRLLRQCLENVERDPTRSEIVKEWDYRWQRHHPPELYDRLIDVAARDMGLVGVAAARLRKQHYQRWEEKLNAKDHDYAFEEEARPLIEDALLAMEQPPIDGRRIMEELGVAPGPKVRELLLEARRVFRPGMKPDELLAAIAVAAGLK